MIKRATGFARRSVPAFVLLMILAAASVRAQNTTASVNEFFRYGVGQEGQSGGLVSKHYLEEAANGQVFIGDLILGFRYQYDDPTELYHQTFQGIKKRYIEYRKDGLSVRAGNLNAMIGRGLSLNLFENRGIYYDTELDGLRLAYRTSFHDISIDAQAMAGTVNFMDFAGVSNSQSVVVGLDTGRLEAYRLQAGEIGFTPHITELKDVFKQIRLGVSWVHATGVFPPSSPFPPPGFDTPVNDSMDVTIPGLTLDVKGKDLQWYVEYAGKRTDAVMRSNNNTGGVTWSGGLYSALTFNRPGFGSSLEYKNYHFDIVGLADQNNERFRTTKALPFMNAPTVFKEHSFTLATRVQHSINFNDEVGFQFDGYYAAMENLLINFNMSASSMHNGYMLSPTTGADSTIVRSSAWLPAFDEAYAAFWEVFAEAEYTFEDESFIKIAFNRNQVPTPNFGRSTSFPMIKGQFALSTDWSVNFDFENQWLFDPHKLADTTGSARILSTDPSRVFSQIVALGFARSPYGGLTAVYEWTTDKTDVSGRRNWFLLEGNVRVGASNTLIISYGAERGGIRCSNGICRQLNSFEGWRMTLASRF